MSARTKLRNLWRSYYDINRGTYGLPRWAAAWDAAKLTWKVRRHKEDSE